jgi:hypothetical protein
MCRVKMLYCFRTKIGTDLFHGVGLEQKDKYVQCVYEIIVFFKKNDRMDIGQYWLTLDLSKPNRSAIPRTRPSTLGEATSSLVSMFFPETVRRNFCRLLFRSLVRAIPCWPSDLTSSLKPTNISTLATVIRQAIIRLCQRFTRVTWRIRR